MKISARLALFLLGISVGFASAMAQQFDPSLYSGMQWRLVGPFRAGRALTATGVPGHPNLFYFGAVGGGVWKTDDAGRTWKPIFDSASIASIGSLAVAPSNPDIIYVGTGEADMRSDISYGNGMYKTIDGGKTWKHIGLEDTRQIGRVIIDPKNPDVVFVAALGHAYGPNAERGVFRSTDGGQTWQKVLFKDEDTGAVDLAFDPRNSKIIFAALWQTRRPPWNVYPPSKGPGSGLYKSSDGGNTWEHLTGLGLPSAAVGRIGIAIAPSTPDRMYLVVDAKEGGIYRSDDAGNNWSRMTSDSRVWERTWYFGVITVDPHNADTVYVPSIAMYRSTDGGRTFEAFKGAPGGDDYHDLWIDPDDSKRMITATDQGTVISLNGGDTWSSWYNQPTAQLYHIVTDNQFPYWIYGAQQDSGSIAVASRTQFRKISVLGWRAVGAGGESHYIAPDPQHPETLFGGSFNLDVTRFDMATGQDQSVPPALAHPGNYRTTWTQPLVFSPADPHALYYGSQQLFVTHNGGESWEIASPDLTREDPGVPTNLDSFTAGLGLQQKRRGVIYTIAPSPLEVNLIWIGTDDGLIQVTRDAGKTWTNVTPSAMSAWSKVALMEASHFDAATAYAAVDRHRLDDLRPYFYRTHDGGKTWQEISNGIPVGSYAQVIREDPARKGLLYAGTETGVFVSFDDGDHWQPLQLNLPNASVRDLIVHGDDLVAGTHGRSIWILDDLAPLRQISEDIAAAGAWLFEPQTAFRVRFGSSDQSTPIPPDEPAGDNPPSGAMIDYYLKTASSGPVVLEIEDAQGKLVRRYSSDDKPKRAVSEKLKFTENWIPAQPRLETSPGMHRFVWDLLYPAPAAPPGFDSWTKSGMWAVPGAYTVKLAVNGKTYSQPLTLKMDPRIKTSQADLLKQFATDREIVAARDDVSRALREATALQKQLQSARSNAEGKPEAANSADALGAKLSAILGRQLSRDGEASGITVPSNDFSSLRYLESGLARLEHIIESGDSAPAPDALTALQKYSELLKSRVQELNAIDKEDLPQLNELLRKAGLGEIHAN
ncbi:MAG: WD40/YVTN/BNR-like repeat-containing protein [Deltaproteobacteria bacterium]